MLDVSIFSYLTQLLWTLLPVWLFGIATGYLLPRPKAFPSNWSSVFLLGLGLRRIVLATQGLFIIREIWYKIADVGTARRFGKAILLYLCGQGWHFDFPSADQPGVPSACETTQLPTDSWYVTEKDLSFFQYHAEGTGATQGASPWEILMEKEIPNVIKYIAWRRVLPNGKSEYKTISTCADATAHEFQDMYLDDVSRPSWDTMITQNEVLENGDFSHRQQVVRWIRKFPFSFISDREYIIGRRSFRQGDNIYGITKAVDHPRAPTTTTVVRMDVFYSMWRSKNVECPWGSGKPAVETLLLHHEQFKIPENLSRFAVRHGMWGFVKKMAQTVPQFVAARRARDVAPDSQDPAAFGAGFAPNPPLGSWGGCKSSPSLSSMTYGGSSMEGSDAASDCPGAPTSLAKGKLRRLATFALASSLALFVHRRGSESGNQMLVGRGKMVNSRSSQRLLRSSSMPMIAGLSTRDGRPRRLLSELD